MISKVSEYVYTGETPLNREPTLPDLIQHFITPADGCAYNRNHSGIPVIDAETHTVTVDGEGIQPLKLSVDQLRNDFPQHEVVCALQCAGNRRHTMRTQLKEVAGIDWFDGAVMNCRWKGPRLRDVLLRAGVKPGEKYSEIHVAFACHQMQCQDDEYYGGSIELWRAMAEDREVILGLEMNGKPLPPAYGYPVRAVVPGVAGARWVKWLDRITVQPVESPNFYQQHDYKILPPEALTWEMAEDYWPKVPAMQCMPVNSVVAVPEDNATVQRDADGRIEVQGYAVPHGCEGPVVRVEVSVDDCETWTDAEILPAPGQSKWAWTLWKARVKVERGEKKSIFSRATDKGGNTQPKCPQWNLRGVGYNGYGTSLNLTIS